MKTKTIVKVIVLALLFLGIFSCLPPMDGKERNTKTVTEEFEIYRQESLQHLRDGCELDFLIPFVEEMVFEFRKLHSTKREVTTGWSGEGNLVVVNSNFRWKAKSAKRFILHEALHKAKVCGDDINPSKTPICYVLGSPCHHSSDISRVIERHLGLKEVAHN